MHVRIIFMLTRSHETDCAYDANSDHRRNAAFKRDNENPQERNDTLGVVAASIRSSTNVEVTAYTSK